MNLADLFLYSLVAVVGTFVTSPSLREGSMAFNLSFFLASCVPLGWRSMGLPATGV
jgi:hypothetical protein